MTNINMSTNLNTHKEFEHKHEHKNDSLIFMFVKECKNTDTKICQKHEPFLFVFMSANTFEQP